MRGRAGVLALTLSLAFAGGAAAQAPAPAPAPRACPDDVSHAAIREQAEYQSGGRTVRGLIYWPARPNGAGVVILHGAGGLGSDAPRFDPHAIQLASRGYYVLLPNYYDAAPGRQRRTMLDMRTWRRAATDGARLLAAQPGAEAGRMAVFGYSLGGFLAGETAMENPEFAAGVSVAGGTDVGEPERDRRAVPLLLIHARRDPAISPGSTRAWAEGLRRRGATVREHELDWEGHFLDGPTWCAVFETTRAFLDRALAAPAA